MVLTYKNTYTDAELDKMIEGMDAASKVFYALATRIGNHAFIEFCGLMNEYIKMCQQARKEGRDFTEANVHMGVPLSVKEFNLEYLVEKLECIFGTSVAGELKKRLMQQVALPPQ